MFKFVEDVGESIHDLPTWVINHNTWTCENDETSYTDYSFKIMWPSQVSARNHLYSRISWTKRNLAVFQTFVHKKA